MITLISSITHLLSPLSPLRVIGRYSIYCYVYIVYRQIHLHRAVGGGQPGVLPGVLIKPSSASPMWFNNISIITCYGIRYALYACIPYSGRDVQGPRWTKFAMYATSLPAFMAVYFEAGLHDRHRRMVYHRPKQQRYIHICYATLQYYTYGHIW